MDKVNTFNPENKKNGPVKAEHIRCRRARLGYTGTTAAKFDAHPLPGDGYGGANCEK